MSLMRDDNVLVAYGAWGVDSIIRSQSWRSSISADSFFAGAMGIDLRTTWSMVDRRTQRLDRNLGGDFDFRRHTCELGRTPDVMALNRFQSRIK